MAMVNQPSTPGSFFSLPREVRNIIYFLALKPAHAAHGYQHLGTTKILSLCKQTYEESIGYLKSLVPIIRLRADKARLFRDPKANGKPLLFSSTSSKHRTYNYQRFTELEMLKCERMVLSIPVSRLGMILLQDHLAEFSNVVAMCTSLQHLDVCVAPVTETGRSDVADCLEMHSDLLAVCNAKAVEVSIHLWVQGLTPEDHDEDGPDEIPVLWHSLRQTIISSGYNAELILHYAWADTFSWYFGLAPNWPEIAVAPEATTARVDHCRTLYRPPKYWKSVSESLTVENCPDNEFNRLNEDFSGFYQLRREDQSYAIIPECRFCLKPYANEIDLRRHLRRFPMHKMPFQRKRWNWVHPKAAPGYRGCPTCGKGYEAEWTLAQHKKKEKHERWGIVPRYSQDNHRYNKMWKKHYNDFGWL